MGTDVYDPGMDDDPTNGAGLPEGSVAIPPTVIRLLSFGAPRRTRPDVLACWGLQIS
jgi:hypothetical protein